MRSFSKQASNLTTLLLAGFGVLLLAVLKVALYLDGDGRGEADPWAAEVPADPKNPFGETRSDRIIKAMYNEPILAAVATPQAQVANLTSTGLESTIPEAAMKRAHAIYQERCASCHGDQGYGKGPGAFAIKPRPRDYTDPEWQKSVEDDELAQAIVRGGAAIGKSYMMPANRDLKSKPDVVNGLVAIIRAFSAH